LERNKLDEPPIANYRLAVAAGDNWPFTSFVALTDED
jgi:hypothetical protein